MVLPTIYVALALRAVMPLSLAPPQVFALLVGIFTLLGWPIVARGVRAIVLTERQRDYVAAARGRGQPRARARSPPAARRPRLRGWCPVQREVERTRESGSIDDRPPQRRRQCASKCI